MIRRFETRSFCRAGSRVFIAVFGATFWLRSTCTSRNANATAFIHYADTRYQHTPNNNDNSSNSDLWLRKTVSSTYESYFTQIKNRLDEKQSEIETTVFVSYDSHGNSYSSRLYSYSDFVYVLRSISVEGLGGGDDEKYFYIGQTDGKGVVHGLVNIAAFLAHAMAISIRYDVCDEFHMDAITEKYAISNSCSQFGRKQYQDEVCTGGEASKTCDVDADMNVIAASALTGEKAPPPFQCRPKENATDYTGYWDIEGGFLSDTFPFANRDGRIDTAGCCWWGRGVLLTRGTCSFGKLNHFLGKKAAAQGFLNFFDVDLCVYPEIVCEGKDTKELRWAIGMFEWEDRVQPFKNITSGWSYMKELDKYVENGFVNSAEFIDTVGGILPFGCFEEQCFAAEAQLSKWRRENFLTLVLDVFELPDLINATPFPTPSPIKQLNSTKQPTKKHTNEPQQTQSPINHPTQKPVNLSPSYNPTVDGKTSPPSFKFPYTAKTVLPTNYHDHSPSTPTEHPSENKLDSPVSLSTLPTTNIAIAPPTSLPTRSSIHSPTHPPSVMPSYVETELISLPSAAVQSKGDCYILFIALVGTSMLF